MSSLLQGELDVASILYNNLPAIRAGSLPSEAHDSGVSADSDRVLDNAKIRYNLSGSNFKSPIDRIGEERQRTYWIVPTLGARDSIG